MYTTSGSWAYIIHLSLLWLEPEGINYKNYLNWMRLCTSSASWSHLTPCCPRTSGDMSTILQIMSLYCLQTTEYNSILRPPLTDNIVILICTFSVPRAIGNSQKKNLNVATQCHQLRLVSGHSDWLIFYVEICDQKRRRRASRYAMICDVRTEFPIKFRSSSSSREGR